MTDHTTPTRPEQRPTPVPSDQLVRRFEYPPVWSWAPSERWLRGYVDDIAVVDSREQILVWEPRQKVPEYGFPLADVRTDLLRPTEPPAPDRGFYRPRRPVAEWYDLVIGDRTVEHAAWKWAPDGLAGFLAVNWFHGVLDRWLEEDETVMTHPRDPYNRVDAVPSSRHVVVSHRGRVLAESSSTVLVFETGLPTRYYFPPGDVNFSALTESPTWSECPYKGYATRYWSVDGEPEATDIAWSYPDPKPNVAAITDRIAFYAERLEIRVDGLAPRAN